MQIEKTVKTKLAITGTGKDDPQYKANITFDFEGIDFEQCAEWGLKDRIIVLQKSLKEMTPTEYSAIDRTTVMVSSIGTGAKGRTPLTVDKAVALAENLDQERLDYMISQLVKLRDGGDVKRQAE